MSTTGGILGRRNLGGIKLIERTATIHLTKLASAQRQLRAAIRMFFGGEDELAVHTVASAAYGILSGLKKDRGRDEAADYHARGLFYAARDYLCGKTPSWLENDPAAMRLVVEFAERLPHGAGTRWEDAHTSISPGLATEYWRKRNKASNFLKHADRDPQSHIALDEVDNFELLGASVVAYIEVAGMDALGNEGLVFGLYFSATIGDDEDSWGDEYQKMVQDLAQINQSERLDFCGKLLLDLNAES